MNQKEIQELIKQVSKSSVTEVEIEKKDFKIVIKSEPKRKRGEVEEERAVYIQQPMAQPIPQMAAPMPQATPASAPAPATGTPSSANSAEDSKLITIKSPMIGTFYRSSAPEKPLLVEVGDSIKEGDAICIIEAMKLFNEIEAEVKGKIVKVLVDDSSPVEYDQPLFLVDPA